jgi:hypothetical protein
MKVARSDRKVEVTVVDPDLQDVTGCPAAAGMDFARDLIGVGRGVMKQVADSALRVTGLISRETIVDRAADLRASGVRHRRRCRKSM